MKPVRREDPLLTNARREAFVVIGMWCLAAAWTIGYSALFGYQAESPPVLVLGVPAWVMWGVFLPWTACTFLSTLVSLFFIRDADLGEDPEEIRSEHEAAREIGDA